MAEVDKLRQRLAREKRKVEILETMIEDKTRQLYLANQALHRSNEELEQFAYVASHDLQEPLRIVASYSELLAQRYAGKLDEKADKYIRYAVDAARRMQALINDLLAYSRLSSKAKPLEPTDVNLVVDQAIANLKVLIRKSEVELTREDFPTVMADRIQMTQLFQNIIGNAIKFRGPEPPRVHISVEVGNAEWVFCVSDNGIGIEPQYHRRIFEIFQRLHGREEYGGTGIGLSIVKKIVERHGGRVWVASEPGKGTRFSFTIPASDQDQVSE